jgi:uncharacterized integral membrane protein
VSYAHRGDDDQSRGDSGFHPTGRQITAAILIVVVVVFALVNLDDVSVDFVFGTVEMPLVFLVVGLLAIGFGAGYLVKGRRERGRRDGSPA